LRKFSKGVAYIYELAAIFSGQMRLIIVIGLLIGQFCCYGQTFNVKGHLQECFDDILDKQQKDLKSTIYITDFFNGTSEEVKTDSLGNFELNKIKGKWRISASGLSTAVYLTPSLVIVLNSDTTITICVDESFRPIDKTKEDEMRNEAKKDIESGEIKLYKFTPWSIITSKDPLAKTNRKAKRYGVKCQLISCMRFSSRGDIEMYLSYSTYNNEVAKYLDSKFGDSWRKKLQYKDSI
jgi:hypothetical protein